MYPLHLMLTDLLKNIALNVTIMLVNSIASDEELEGPMKDQPLSADASPTALSPAYFAYSDPEEDKEEPKRGSC
ncbi:hypothetical protein Tco_0318666 [Tanacetum coccineum]